METETLLKSFVTESTKLAELNEKVFNTELYIDSLSAKTDLDVREKLSATSAKLTEKVFFDHVQINEDIVKKKIELGESLKERDIQKAIVKSIEYQLDFIKNGVGKV
jgi:hypothetical protein